MTNGNSTQRTTETGTGDTRQGQQRKGRKIDDVIDAPLQSADVQAGQYPARFIGFGDTTIWLPSKFAKGGKAGGLVEKMNAFFCVKVGDGVRILTSLVSPPTSAGLSSMSNLFKFVKVLGAGDSDLWDGSIDNIKRGTKLSSFVGKTAMAVCDKDKKGFARVSHLVMAPEGVPIPFPTEEEASQALEVFLHSGEAEANLPESTEDVPF